MPAPTPLIDTKSTEVQQAVAKAAATFQQDLKQVQATRQKRSGQRPEWLADAEEKTGLVNAAKKATMAVTDPVIPNLPNFASIFSAFMHEGRKALRSGEMENLNAATICKDIQANLDFQTNDQDGTTSQANEALNDPSSLGLGEEALLHLAREFDEKPHEVVVTVVSQYMDGVKERLGINPDTIPLLPDVTTGAGMRIGAASAA
jgi:hypothetical protein